jgi:hypothetical protein
MSEDEAKSTSGHNADELAPAQHPDNLQDGELGDSQKTEDQNDVRERLDGNNEGNVNYPRQMLKFGSQIL